MENDMIGLLLCNNYWNLKVQKKIKKVSENEMKIEMKKIKYFKLGIIRLTSKRTKIYPWEDVYLIWLIGLMSLINMILNKIKKFVYVFCYIFLKLYL
jgi:hypothetical protein